MSDALAVVMTQRRMGQPRAAAYYAMAPDEPVLDDADTVTVVQILKDLSVHAILGVVKESKPANLLLVAHGGGSGVEVPLWGNKNHVLLSPDLPILIEHIDDKPNAATARDLGMSLGQLREFQRSVQAARGILDRLEIRACIVGSDRDTLVQLQKFFGAQSVTAPTELDVFGRVQASFSTEKKIWDKWHNDHPNANVGGEPGSRVSFDWNDGRPQLQAESSRALKVWITEHMGNNKYQSGYVYYHAILEESSKPLAFPRDQRYRQLLRRVPELRLPR